MTWIVPGWFKMHPKIYEGYGKVAFNKTGTSKVGAISKAQKAQKTFFEKKLEIFEFCFFQKMSHSAGKCKRGTLWALLTYILLQNIKKTRKGDSFETSKNFRKMSHNAEKKIERGTGPLSLVRFCWLRYKNNKK